MVSLRLDGSAATHGNGSTTYLASPGHPDGPSKSTNLSVSRRPRQLLSVSESPSKILAHHHPALCPKVLTVFAFARHHSCNDGKQKTVQVQVLFCLLRVVYQSMWCSILGAPFKIVVPAAACLGTVLHAAQLVIVTTGQRLKVHLLPHSLPFHY
jgi:hypothetical protein